MIESPALPFSAPGLISYAKRSSPLPTVNLSHVPKHEFDRLIVIQDDLKVHNYVTPVIPCRCAGLGLKQLPFASAAV